MNQIRKVPLHKFFNANYLRPLNKDQIRKVILGIK